MGVALLLLVACAAPDAGGSGVFRPASAAIYSAAAFDASVLQGGWTQVASFAAPGTPGCRGGAVAFKPTASGLSIEGALCLDGREVRLSGPVARAGPGRLSVPGMEDWWILWVDSGSRTLAVGTPSGRFGFVLDRAAIPADRLTAAREIFDFNGYRTSDLKSI